MLLIGGGRLRVHKHDHTAALQLGGLFHIAYIGTGLCKALHDTVPQLGMRHLTAAEAMGITAVVLSAHCPDLFSPKVIRSTMGSGWRQKTVRVDDLAGSIAAWQKQGLRCYAATLSPEALPLQRLPAGECRGIVIGTEGNGVSREVIDACNGEVYIPMRGAAESLNAAAAAALCMWELSGRGYLPG